VAVDGGLRLNLRAAPDLTAEVVGALENATAVAVLARTAAGDWLQVQTADGTAGWVRAEMVTLTAPVEQLPVVQEAD
jgi:uncharacterized protein YgiM (DUF1202 family)